MTTTTNNGFEYSDSDGDGLTGWELHERYDEVLDEVYEPVTVTGMQYQTSRALRELDPIAYRCGFNDWLDSEVQDGQVIEL